MSKEEILRLYSEDSGYNPQDLIGILDTKLDAQTTRSLDGSLVIYFTEALTFAVSQQGIEFIN